MSTAEGRRFGLTVGGAFLALAGLAAWRGHATEAPVLAAAGGVLVIAAVLIPARLSPVRRGWMALAAAISRVTTPVIMGVIYFAVVTPTGWIRRLVAGNRLRREHRNTSFWVARPPGGGQGGNMERQF